MAEFSAADRTFYLIGGEVGQALQRLRDDLKELHRLRQEKKALQKEVSEAAERLYAAEKAFEEKAFRDIYGDLRDAILAEEGLLDE